MRVMTAKTKTVMKAKLTQNCKRKKNLQRCPCSFCNAYVSDVQNDIILHEKYVIRFVVNQVEEI